MADAIDATYGGSAADSYIALADANAWIRNNVLEPEAWEKVAGVGNKQTVSLRMATRLIDAAAPWHGARYFWNQRLEFPRQLGSVDAGSGEPDAAFTATLTVDEYLRQQKLRVQAACCFQAVRILADGRDTDRDAQYRGITGNSRGHRFSESASYGRPHMALVPEAWDQLGPYEGDPVLRRGGSTLVGGRTAVVGSLP